MLPIVPCIGTFWLGLMTNGLKLQSAPAPRLPSSALHCVKHQLQLLILRIVCMDRYLRNQGSLAIRSTVAGSGSVLASISYTLNVSETLF